MNLRRLLIYTIAFLFFAIVCNNVFFRFLKLDSSFTNKKWVIVNHLKYGPRLPITILTLPFSQGNVYSAIVELPAKRIKLGNVNRFDVVAFNSPRNFDEAIDKRKKEIARVIALPGEEIYIRKTEIKVDDKKLKQDFPVKFKYRITCDSVDFPEVLKEKYELEQVKFITHPWVYDIIMEDTHEESLLSEEEILYVRRTYEQPNRMNYYVYPFNNYYPWNEDNIGPVTVPKKGYTVAFSFRNYYLYKDIIEVHEKNQISIYGEKILCNGKELKNYTFKQNYYYVLNDNRTGKNDSRYWGFIPENHIIGKVIGF